jgi:Skp family chaperone for outer membrane proteins
MPKTPSFILVAISILTYLSGCQFIDNSSHRVETVYLDPVAIAKALGRDRVISQQEEAARIQLNTGLERIATDLNRQLEDEKNRLGEKPAKDDQQKLDSLTLSASQQLQQTKLQAQQKLVNFRQQLVLEFRNEIAVLAKPIAEQRGATTISIIDAGIIWLDPSADITDEVIASMRAKSSEPVATDAGNNTETDVVPAETSAEISRLNELVDNIQNQKNAE